ncbi:hypothetical protein GCM10025868_21630 [Angustibacter aerolatus]|uniref:Nudix hydrolase domain-containing protein n=1 Tax=Angustibacter aerolatus TaxID=1162965 RepID=A0ABQ6JHP2_9ACTN|nr:hypothetical protein [Angustibacter aerolatus]GMA86913.1 hypothetical protein GCM10025868_21630 [Angustibacter aerolatus]
MSRSASLTHVFDVFMSPGSVTECLHHYAAPYTAASRTSAGGGLVDEGEDIEVLELDFDVALEMTADARIADAKTILLLQWAALRGPFSSLVVEHTPDGRYVVIDGRRWRATDPAIPEAEAAVLRREPDERPSGRRRRAEGRRRHRGARRPRPGAGREGRPRRARRSLVGAVGRRAPGPLGGGAARRVTGVTRSRTWLTGATNRDYG